MDISATIGEVLDIVRKDKNPNNKWLVRNSHGQCTVVASNHILSFALHHFIIFNISTYYAKSVNITYIYCLVFWFLSLLPSCLIGGLIK